MHASTDLKSYDVFLLFEPYAKWNDMTRLLFILLLCLASHVAVAQEPGEQVSIDELTETYQEAMPGKDRGGEVDTEGDRSPSDKNSGLPRKSGGTRV